MWTKGENTVRHGSLENIAQGHPLRYSTGVGSHVGLLLLSHDLLSKMVKSVAIFSFQWPAAATLQSLAITKSGHLHAKKRAVAMAMLDGSLLPPFALVIETPLEVALKKKSRSCCPLKIPSVTLSPYTALSSRRWRLREPCLKRSRCWRTSGTADFVSHRKRKITSTLEVGLLMH